MEDPKNVIYVDPQTPVVLTPEDLPSPPHGEIEVVVAPKYGTLDITPAGQITYTPGASDSKSPTVDVIEIKYTNLSGAVVVVRKEFVVTQKGDVPRIIQTGYESGDSGLKIPALLITLLITPLILRFFRREKNHG